MLANLFGDFVKGRNFSHFPQEIQNGVILHRKIDSYMDQHQSVMALKLKLYEELPKVAGVAVDLFFDHLLAKNWSNHHAMNYEDFLDEFYTHRSDIEKSLSDEFLSFISIFRTRKWLNHYPTSYGLEKSCQGVSARISFPNTLKDAPNIFYKYESDITIVFNEYMKDADQYFSIQNNKNF